MIIDDSFYFQESQKSLEKPDVIKTLRSPERYVPVHPGAGDDTDDEEDGVKEEDSLNKRESNVAPAAVEASVPPKVAKKPTTMQPEPIENLVDEPIDDA